MNNDSNETEITVSKSDFIEYFVKKIHSAFSYVILILTLISAVVCFLIITSDPGGSWITLDFRPTICILWSLLILFILSLIGIINFILKKYQQSVFAFYSAIIGVILNGFIIWFFSYVQYKYFKIMIVLCYLLILIIIFAVFTMSNSKKKINICNKNAIKQKCVDFIVVTISYLSQFYFYYYGIFMNISSNGINNPYFSIGVVVIVLLNIVPIIFFIIKKRYLSIIQMILMSGYVTLIFLIA